MAKRKLTTRQAWRVKKIQEDRLRRASRQQERTERELAGEALGPVQHGLVTANFGANVEIEGVPGERRRCAVRQNIGPLVVGDRVAWQLCRDSDTGVVIALEPRSSLLARPDLYGQTKPLAANIDQILVVSAPLPAYDTDLIDQYLVAAESTGIEPVIVFNKTDLLDVQQRREVDAQLQLYQRIGYYLIHASTVSQHGLEPLRHQLQGRASVFAGQSGVGKSSLIKSLLPEMEIQVGALTEQTGLGRHTTSVSRLYHLPTGGDVIDSPGVREFRLWAMARSELAHGFVEFRPLLGHCRFRDCRHEDDPGCALRAAAEAGEISERRLESFRRLAAAMEAADKSPF